MDKVLSLKIEFSKILSEKEQMDFWDSLVDEIEKLQLRTGGGHDELKLDWMLDFSESSLNKGEIIDRLSDILLSNDKLILNFEIK